jgi:aquaporin Z
VDHHQPWHRTSDVALIHSDTDDGTASGKRSAAHPAMEAVGNFVLVFAFGVAIATHGWYAPLLIGAALVAMVYSKNRVPDAHYNPSLTFATLMRGRIAMQGALPLWLTQLGSGLLAATLVRAVVDPRQLAITAATVKGSTVVAAIALELIFTSALCVVAFDVSRSNSRTADDYNSWPIALGVMTSAVAFGIATNGVFDPAVNFDDAVLGILSWPTVWIYLVSQPLSGIAATITFVTLDGQR